jgi:hypothetical protein
MSVLSRGISTLLFAAIFLTACGEDLKKQTIKDKKVETKAASKMQEDPNPDLFLAWNSANNPARMSGNFAYRFESLPTWGYVNHQPWPGSYWPTYLDSINYKWNGAGSVSASRKYQQAFTPGTDIEALVSAAQGADRNWGLPRCYSNSDCAMGSYCAKRSSSLGQCIPSWWGICDGWASAATTEPEPRHSVWYNGVQFHVNDIKALVTYSHMAGMTRIMLADRCNSNPQWTSYDRTGLPAEPACADANPGTFHVVLANMVGIRKESVIQDRNWGYQVWNHPIRSFYTLVNREVSAGEAGQLTGYGTTGGGTGTRTVIAQKSGYFPTAGAWHNIGAYPVAAGEAISVEMTGTGDADLYVKYGSPNNYYYAYDCRPYLPGSNETCNLYRVSSNTTAYVYVHGFKPATNYTVKIIKVSGTGGSTYARNPSAVRFRHIKTAVSYIELVSPAYTQPLTPQINNFTKWDNFEYILELDGAGNIIGGEWIGASKNAHPDFLWIARDRRNTTVSGINYGNVKRLLDLSIQ